MKRIYKIALLVLTIPLWIACSDESETQGPETIQLNGLAVQTRERTAETEVNTRAGEGFAVNTANDPTFDITRLQGGGGANVGVWTLTATIYDKDDAPYYDPGSVTWTYGSGHWNPSATLYLPSYSVPIYHPFDL